MCDTHARSRANGWRTIRKVDQVAGLLFAELLRFSRIVSKIGVLGFSVKNLRQYMGEGFHKARITYIYLGNELAGFFIAVYRKDGDGYSGSGFPCIKYKFRGNAVRNAANIEGETYINERRAVSSPFTAMMASLIFDFINFYWRDVNQGNWSNLIPDLIGAIEQQIRRKNPKSQLILDMCLEMANLFVPRNGNLTIRAIAENPIMYQKLMEMNLTFDGQDPRPSQKELEKIANWDTKKLLSPLAKSWMAYWATSSNSSSIPHFEK